MGNRFIWPFVTGYIYSSSWVITHYSSARVAMMNHPSMVGGRVYRNRTHFLSISDALGWRHCDHGHFEQPAMQVCMVNVCSRIGWSHLVFIWYIYMCFSWWCSTSSIYAIQLLTFGIPWNSFLEPHWSSIPFVNSRCWPSWTVRLWVEPLPLHIHWSVDGLEHVYPLIMTKIAIENHHF